jgi:alkyl hydroperoxide reductase subunit AhpC
VDPLESHGHWVKDINETQDTTVELPDPGRSGPQGGDALRHDPPECAGQRTVRSVFIIDPRRRSRDPDLPGQHGRNFDEILRVIDSLQLTDNHKVATPANWKMATTSSSSPACRTRPRWPAFPEGIQGREALPAHDSAAEQVMPEGLEFL